MSATLSKLRHTQAPTPAENHTCVDGGTEMQLERQGGRNILIVGAIIKMSRERSLRHKAHTADTHVIIATHHNTHNPRGGR